MKRLSATLLAFVLLAAPLSASPAPKRFACQVTKAPAREAKRIEQCRKPAIPPLLDPTPLFLASAVAAPSRAPLSDLS